MAPISAPALFVSDTGFKDRSKTIVEAAESVMGWSDAMGAATDYTGGAYKCQPKKCNSAKESLKQQSDTENNSQTETLQN